MLRIDWSEMDLYGHVNNISFFKYIQAGRVNFWEQNGINELFKNSGIGPMLASCSCDFKRPLFFPGNIIVHSETGSINNTSFKIHHKIFTEKNEIAAEGVDVIVMYNFKDECKVEIPDLIRKKLLS